MVRRTGLGRGLEALLPSAETADGASRADDGGARLTSLPLEAIVPNRFQPRQHFDDESLSALTASISVLGVLQPVLVRPLPEGTFELIAGERRWRAARAAGLTEIPVLVRTVEDEGALEQALVENLHREDLNPLEEAAGYQQLIEEFSMTQDAVAARVGKSRSAVANTLRLLQLPPSLQQLVADRSLSAGHARALLACEDPEEQHELARRIVAEELSVRETEDAVRRLVAARYPDEAKPNQRRATVRPAPLLELEELLAEHLETRVRVSVGAQRGRIVIEFADVQDLERVFHRITAGSTGAGDT